MRERLRRLAWLLDSSIRIPGTRWSVGIDALIGLVPVLGDAAAVILSSYIVDHWRFFDAGFKANQRNIRLLGL